MRLRNLMGSAGGPFCSRGASACAVNKTEQQIPRLRNPIRKRIGLLRSE
jgi:hypothetical protein